jgi:hypothetical protein
MTAEKRLPLRRQFNPSQDVNNFTHWQERSFVSIIIKVHANQTPVIRTNKGASNPNLVRKCKAKTG